MEEMMVPKENGNQALHLEERAMSIEQLRGEVGVIHAIADEIMEDGVHYGRIPGVEKKCLLKPGADIMARRFCLYPEYTEIDVIHEPSHIYYRILCTLKTYESNITVATGEGSCSSMEDKYRWRYKEESTGVAVPEDYWKAKKKGNSKEMKRIVEVNGGTRVAKIDGQWVICTAEKIENDNPYNLDNTLLKMAQKRAFVAAVIHATGCSDIFTQDMEDQGETGEDKPKESKPKPKKAPPKKDVDAETGEITIPENVQMGFNALGLPEEEQQRLINDYKQDWDKIDSYLNARAAAMDQ